VGDAGYVDNRPVGLLAILSGGEWAVAERLGVAAIDVDCWAADGCVAAMSGEGPRLEAWDGTRWRGVENPPGIVEPTAVACGAPAQCEVVGAFVDGGARAAAATVVLDT
jgi:hypothetical protein